MNALPITLVATRRPSALTAYADELADLATATAYNLHNATEEWQRRDILALHLTWAANARRRYRAAVIDRHLGIVS